MEKRTVVVSLKMSAVLKGKLRSYAHKHHCTVSRAGVDIVEQFLTRAHLGHDIDHVPVHEIVDLEYDREHGVEILGPVVPPGPDQALLLEGHDASS